ncbi:MAG: FHA domain-containing protein [Bdellovibrionales bacterium]|nr:FHA domain-containing protein [Bdellovibrionales bacterium]
MATDSTELTFVRCPSCRSLVPAVSSRCRMCGAGLDSNDEMAGAAESKKEQPVVAAAANGKKAAAPAVEAKNEEEDFDDPLGDYLQDFDDDGGDSQEDEEDGGTEEVEERPRPSSPPKLKVESGSKKGGLSFRKNRDPEEPRPEAAPEKPQQQQSKPQREENREPVARADNGRSDNSRADNSRADNGRAEGGRSERRSRRERERARQERRAEREQSQSVAQPKREEAPRQQQAAPQEAAPHQRQHNEQRLNDAISHAPAATLSRSASQEGRLYGWLVSFKNSNGQALELREGKFFVTSSSLKDNDLVLDSPSISTPHALVAVSAERGLVVQDLMSDRGVFLRTSDEDTYRKEEETVRLEHGDWIRFGDEEFLVSLIPTPPRR